MTADEHSPTPGGTELPLERTRARALCFQVLTLLWIFPTAGAALILARDFSTWTRWPSIGERVGAVPLQSWIALAVVAAHIVFIILSRRYRRLAREARAVRSLPSGQDAWPG